MRGVETNSYALFTPHRERKEPPRERSPTMPESLAEKVRQIILDATADTRYTTWEAVVTPAPFGPPSLDERNLREALATITGLARVVERLAEELDRRP
jgi:hypothetical protein